MAPPCDKRLSACGQASALFRYRRLRRGPASGIDKGNDMASERALFAAVVRHGKSPGPGRNARALCALLACAGAQGLHAQTVVEYQPGVRLGQGFDNIDDSVRGECVLFELDTTGPGATAQGQTEQYKLFEVSDSYQLAEAMDLSLATKYKSMFGTAIEGKASLARKQTVSQFASTFVARMSVRNPAQSAVRVRLTDAMADLARTSPADFHQRCGNHFVASVVTGGEFIGYVSILTLNRSEQEKISASYNAKYGLGGSFESQGSVDKDFLESIESRSKTVDVYHSGGTPSVVRDVATMYQALDDFAASVRGTGAVPYQAFLQRYDTLPNFPALASVGQKEQGLARILDQAWQLRSVAEDVRYIRAHPEQFAMRSVPAGVVDQTKATVEQRMLAFEAAAEACKSTGECTLPAGPGADDLRDALPPRYRSPCAPLLVKDIPPLEVPATSHYGPGDTEMGGNRPKIHLKVTLQPEDQTLKALAEVTMEESKSDWTKFRGSISRVVASLNTDTADACLFDPDQRGVEVTGAIDQQASKDDHAWTPYPGSNLVKSAECRSDTVGDDSGKLGCKNILLEPPRLKLRHLEDVATTSARTRANQERRARTNAMTRRILGLTDHVPIHHVPVDHGSPVIHP